MLHPGQSVTKILSQDHHLVAVNKPAGLPVHRMELDRERDVALQRVRDAIGRRVDPIHRLDRGTSGALVFALSPAAAGRPGVATRSGAIWIGPTIR